MTKQEEIRKVVDTYTDDGCLYPERICNALGSGYCSSDEEAYKCLMQRLTEIGVVIKVDVNTTDFIKCPCDDCTAEHKLIDEWGYFCDLTCGQRSHWQSRLRGQEQMLKAGYVATEPLIKE